MTLKSPVTSHTESGKSAECFSNQNTGNIVEFVLCVFLVPMAILTLWTQVGQVKEFAFASLSAGSATILAATLGFGLIGLFINRSKIARFAQFKFFLILCAVSLIVALLTISIPRFDNDEFNYLPKLVELVSGKEAKITGSISYYFNQNNPVNSFHFSNSYTYEYIQAQLSFLTGISIHTIRWIYYPFVISFLCMFAIFLLVDRFEPNNYFAIVGIIFMVFAISIMADSHRSPGNWAFTRLYQGKGVLFALCMPLISIATLRFMEKSRIASGILLVSSVIFAMSTTPSAGFLIPALMSTIFIAWMLCSIVPESNNTLNSKRYVNLIRDLFYNNWGKFILLIMLILYILLWSAVIYINTPSILTVGDSVANSKFPSEFIGQTKLIFNERFPVTLAFLLGSLIFSMILLKNRNRILLATIVILQIGFFLNPISARFLIDNVTTSNTYWRLFYIFPWWLMLCLSAILVWRYVKEFPRLISVGLVAAGLVLLSVPHILCFTGTSKLCHISILFKTRLVQPDLANSVLFAQWPVSESEYREVRELNGIIGQKIAILAPYDLAGQLALFNGGQYFTLRPATTLYFSLVANRPEEGKIRIAAARMLSSSKNMSLPSIKLTLENSFCINTGKPMAMVIPKSNIAVSSITGWLNIRGLMSIGETENYHVVSGIPQNIACA